MTLGSSRHYGGECYGHSRKYNGKINLLVGFLRKKICSCISIYLSIRRTQNCVLWGSWRMLAPVSSFQACYAVSGSVTMSFFRIVYFCCCFQSFGSCQILEASWNPLFCFPFPLLFVLFTLEFRGWWSSRLRCLAAGRLGQLSDCGTLHF